jgi:hypothetical protein
MATLSSLVTVSGEVGEKTSYVPVPAARYLAVISMAEMVDPVSMGWKVPDDANETDRADFERPFPRLRWKIESLENGEPTEYAGRLVDQRLDLRSGTNPRTGRGYAEHRADLLRAANGLKAGDEVLGLKLIDIDTRGMDREEALLTANHAMKKYEGVRATVRVINITSRKTGEARESVGKIVLPK